VLEAPKIGELILKGETTDSNLAMTENDYKFCPIWMQALQEA
jgi:hypothetical protein